MARITSRVGCLLVVVLAVGCATTRTGSGSAVSGTNAAKFSWTSAGNVSGSMTATLANGETFTGQFYQITSSLTDELGPQGPTWHQEGVSMLSSLLTEGSLVLWGPRHWMEARQVSARLIKRGGKVPRH